MNRTAPRSTRSHCGSLNALDQRVVASPSIAFDAGNADDSTDEAAAATRASAADPQTSASLVVPRVSSCSATLLAQESVADVAATNKTRAPNVRTASLCIFFVMGRFLSVRTGGSTALDRALHAAGSDGRCKPYQHRAPNTTVVCNSTLVALQV